MTVRVPPRMATWLLTHLGPSYRNESLAGDLYEEYQLNRTPNWYWRQVLVAICIGRVASVRHILSVALLRLAIEVAGGVGILGLAAQFGRACSLGRIWDIAWLFTLAGGIGLYLAATRRNAPIKQLLRVFAMLALSAGTVTWASSTSHLTQRCTHRSNPSAVSFPAQGSSRGN